MIERSQAWIERDLAGRRGLVSGHKKDIVIGKKHGDAENKVVIYGGRDASRNVVQPETSVHSASYWDYSHAARMVRYGAELNGSPIDLRTFLTEDRYAAMLSKTGKLRTIDLAY